MTFNGTDHLSRQVKKQIFPEEFRLISFWRRCFWSLKLPKMQTMDEINFRPRSGPQKELPHILSKLLTKRKEVTDWVTLTTCDH